MPSLSDPFCSIPLPSRFATANPRGRWRPGRPRRLPPPSSSSPRHDLPGVFFPAFVGRSGNRIWMSSQHLTFFSLLRGGVRGREGVVLLQPARPQVRDGAAHQPRHAVRLLEGHRQGPRHQPRRRRRGGGGDAQDASVLPGEGAQGEEDGVGHAQVPHGKTTTRGLPPQGTTISRKTGCCVGYCTRVEPLQGYHLKRPASDDSLLLFPSRCQLSQLIGMMFTCVFCSGDVESISSDISGITSDEATKKIKLLIKSLSRLL